MTTIPRPVAMAAALVLSWAGAAPLRAEGLPGSWREVRSEHFDLIGNETEGNLKKIAGHFEQIRALFETVLARPTEARVPPLLVLVARDRRTFERLMPSTVAAHGKAGNVIGVFSSRRTLQFITIRADLDYDTGIQVVNREYFHFLVRQTGLRLPIWLNEGLADFWSTAKLKKDSTEVGHAIPNRLASLAQPRRIPFETLVQVDANSPEYRRPGLTPILFGEAWALVHYATLGDASGERAKQLRAYLAAVASGEDSLVAARATFGDLGLLQRQVDGYVERKRFKFARGAAIAAPAESSFSAQALTDAEAAARVAVAQLHVERRATVEPLLQRAIEGAPDFAATHAAEGFAAIQDRDSAAAAREFELAIAGQYEGPLASYGAAVAEIARNGAKSDWEKVERLLLQSVAADSRFVPAYSRLADVYVRRPGDEKRSLAMIRQARALEPLDEVLELREARILRQLGDADAAKTAIDKAVKSGIESEYWGYQNKLCWQGALLGFTAEVRELCDLAVEESKGSASARDSRAVVRAISGDLAGAAEDLRAVLDSKRFEDLEQFRQRRTAWLAELEKGVNPLTPEELQALLDSPMDSATWGY